MPKLFSVLIGCYGNFAHYTARAVDGVIKNSSLRQEFDVLVGCNECCAESVSALRSYYDEGKIDQLVESRKNINKDPMMRVLIDLCETPYLLWMDDDSHVLPGWDAEILKFIKARSPFDLAGHVHYADARSDRHKAFMRSRQWYHSEKREALPLWFAVGGMFLARTDFLRQHNFPDRDMVKHLDDRLLGDLCQQQEARLVNFGGLERLMSTIRISDGERRGTGEGRDGWRVDYPKA